MSEMKCCHQGESIHTDKSPKCQIQFIHGGTMTLFVWAFEEGGFADAHVHPHEQIIHWCPVSPMCTSGAAVYPGPVVIRNSLPPGMRLHRSAMAFRT